MSVSLYDISIPTCLRMLGSLSTILDKGAAHAEARKIDPAALLQARLFPDMFPLARQVQIASDAAKGGGSRLAGIDAPSWPDNEASFADLQARIAKTEDFLKSLDRAKIDAAAEREITFKAGKTTRTMTGLDYVTAWMFPNFFFHVTTTHAILRHNGVEVGKADFLGKLPGKSSV